MYRHLNKLLCIIPAFLMVWAGAGCAHDKTGGAPVGPESGEQVKVSFLVDAPTSLPTRADGTVPDGQIATLDILAFTVEGSSEKYSYTANSVKWTDTGDANIKEVTANIIKGSKTQRFVLIANAKDELASMILDDTLDKEDIVSTLLFANNSKWSNASDDFTPIPMWGQTETAIINDDSDITLEATLLRMASRLEIYLSEDIRGYSLSELHVYNAKSRGTVAPDPVNLIYNSGQSTHKVSVPTLPQDNDGSNPLVMDTPLSYQVLADTGKLPYVYLFESEASAGKSDQNAPFVVVGITAGTETDPTYYRIDFAGTDNEGNFVKYYDLLRNHRYIFNVTAVGAKGYATVDEAAASDGSNIASSLYVWDQGDMTEFVFNSSYALGVSRKEFELPKPSSINDLLVTTDYPGGWKASVDETLYPWLSIVSAEFSEINAKDPLRFRVKENNDKETRTGYIKIQAGTLSQTIKVVQTTEEVEDIFIRDISELPISELVFVRYPGSNNPAAQQFKVEWSPTSEDLDISHSAGIPAFDYGSADDLSAISSISGTPYTFTIQPPAFTDKEVEDNPFIEKSSTARFSISSGSGVKSEDITMRHISYDLTADIKSLYYLNGTVQSLTVKSNTEWTAEFNSNKIISQPITTQGGNNTAGEEVEFRMETDPNKLITDKTAVIVFTCTTPEGDIFRKEYTITATSDDPEITGANSYFLKPGGNTVSIPINWANKDGVQRILPTDDIDLKFIWTDNPEGMKASGAVKSLSVTGLGVNRELVVTSGSSAGNAVVGVSVGGELRWTWHIWVTDYDPNAGGQTYYNNGYTIMDRHLGALTGGSDQLESLGLYYQWARKDPFPRPDVLSYSGGTAPPMTGYVVYDQGGNPIYASTNTASLLDNLELGVRNPLVFYQGARKKTQAYLWKAADGSKGPQDPCPQGWRLPSENSLWTGVTKNPWSEGQKHLSLSGLGTWQCGGYVITGSTNCSMLGNYVMLWSNDVNDNNESSPLYLGGPTTSIDVQNVSLTSGGNVRCVKE